MEVRKIGNYQFVNNWKGNRSGFVHETTLFKENEYGMKELATYKCQYYNRTWECYTYQSVMQNCIYSLIEKLQKRTIENFKITNNIKRLKTEIKEKVLKDLENTDLMKEYRQVYKALEYRV